MRTFRTREEQLVDLQGACITLRQVFRELLERYAERPKLGTPEQRLREAREGSPELRLLELRRQVRAVEASALELEAVLAASERRRMQSVPAKPGANSRIR